MIRTAREGEITWLPGIATSDIPHPLPKGIVIHLREDVVGLEVQGLVGIIPLRNGDSLRITPKIDHANFLQLLFRAEGLKKDLCQEYKDFVFYSVEDTENISSIVARQLLSSVSEILRRSPKRERIKKIYHGKFAVGRINIIKTLYNTSCHKEDPIVSVVNEVTLNSPENCIITEALMRAWGMIKEDIRIKFQTVYDIWARTFTRSADIYNDIETVTKRLASQKYGGPRDYYRKALMLSQIILGIYGIGIKDTAVIQGDAVLLNTAEVFEKYLRATISRSYSNRGYIVTKGCICTSSLYTDGSYELNPDIVISKGGKTLLIVDAKYKKPTAGDHYQINTYLSVNQVKRGILLAPRFEGNDILIREYCTHEKNVIREVYLPMNSLDITESFLDSVVEKFA